MTRIQVIVTVEEREAFRRRAAAQGRSLSSWLRDAGRQQLERTGDDLLTDRNAVRRFFDSLPDEGLEREPDWEGHRTALQDSRTSGLPAT